MCTRRVYRPQDFTSTLAGGYFSCFCSHNNEDNLFCGHGITRALHLQVRIPGLFERGVNTLFFST